MDLLIADEMILLERTIDFGELFEGKCASLHDQIIDGDFHAFFAEVCVEGLAHDQHIRHIDFVADIEVRNGLF